MSMSHVPKDLGLERLPLDLVMNVPFAAGRLQAWQSIEIISKIVRKQVLDNSAIPHRLA